MPRRKEPRVRPPPTPRTNRRSAPEITQTTEETLDPEEAPSATNDHQNFQMDPTMMQNMLAQGIATALATYEAARNGNTGNRGSGTPVDAQRNPKHCSYKEFMGCKPRSFYGTEGAVILSCWIEKTEGNFHISSYQMTAGSSMVPAQ